MFTICINNCLKSSHARNTYNLVFLNKRIIFFLSFNFRMILYLIKHTAVVFCTFHISETSDVWYYFFLASRVANRAWKNKVENCDISFFYLKIQRKGKWGEWYCWKSYCWCYLWSLMHTYNTQSQHFYILLRYKIKFS